MRKGWEKTAIVHAFALSVLNGRSRSLSGFRDMACLNVNESSMRWERVSRRVLEWADRPTGSARGPFRMQRIEGQVTGLWRQQGQALGFRGHTSTLRVEGHRKETYLVRSRFCASVKTSQFFPDVIWKFKALDAGSWAGHFWLKFAQRRTGVTERSTVPCSHGGQATPDLYESVCPVWCEGSHA